MLMAVPPEPGELILDGGTKVSLWSIKGPRRMRHLMLPQKRSKLP
jgi:hypothetical protein